ncbi:MAG: lytic transglycosylase domain-containing protein [Bacillota bacterium]
MKNFKALKIIAIALATAVATIAIFAYFSDYQNAKKYYQMGGDNPALFLAIAKAESGFSATAVSNKGAVGLCQLMPKTAEWCAGQMGIEYNENMLLDAQTNAKIAVFYIDYLLAKFDETSAICAYNAGEGNVTGWLLDTNIYQNGEYKSMPFPETENYLKKVQAYQKKFKFYIWFFGWDK